MLGLAAIGAAWSWQSSEPARSSPPLSIGLFGTLPILWNEAGGISDLLSDKGQPHWALAVLRRHGPVTGLDRLDLGERPQALSSIALLVMAQPRPLSPQENVALDDWVRGGGHVLLFADPMLTQDSRFSPGDPRRPQDIAMLSPILGRWGLRLTYDEMQAPGERTIEVLGKLVPVNLAGRFETVPGTAACRIDADGILARCRIGRGRVVVLADAAMLDPQRGQTGPDALERLISDARP